MMPYVAYVLENPNHNWLIYSMALLLRSRLEKERTRTVERSCYQLQVLVDQIKDQSPTFTDRYKFFWLLAYPSNLELQRELGKRLDKSQLTYILTIVQLYGNRYVGIST